MYRGFFRVILKVVIKTAGIRLITIQPTYPVSMQHSRVFNFRGNTVSLSYRQNAANGSTTAWKELFY